MPVAELPAVGYILLQLAILAALERWIWVCSHVYRTVPPIR